MESTAAQLIMVYNADGDKVSVLLNMAHKIVSPSTYECSLCSITHGAFTMRARWKDFLKQFPRKPRELHRDEFLKEFPETAISFPAILVRFGNEQPRVLVTSVGLNRSEERRVGKGVSVRVDLGGRRIINKKNTRVNIDTATFIRATQST